MTALYCIICFAAGFFFGVLATSLAVISGDKRKRDYDTLAKNYEQLETDHRVLKVANDELLRQKKELVERWVRLADELHIPKEAIFCGLTQLYWGD